MTVGTRAEKVLQWPGLRGMAALGLVGLALLTGCATSSGTGFAQSQEEAATAAASGGEGESDAQRRARIRLELAASYFERGQFNVALDEIRQVLAINPNLADAYNLRGLVFMRLDDQAMAQESFRRAASLRPNDPDVAHNYGWLLCQQKNYVLAQQQFEQALAQRNYTARHKTFMAQGLCLQAEGKEAPALQALLKSYELDPGNPVVGYNLALLLRRQGDLERAQFYIRRLNNSELANAQSLWLGMKIEHALRNDVALRQLSEQLQRRFPQSPEAGLWARRAFDE